MAQDLKLKYDNGLDFVIENNDFIFVDCSETQAFMQIFFHKRLDSEEQPNIFLRGGWWGNCVFYSENMQIGSKFIPLMQGNNLPSANYLATIINNSFSRLDNYITSSVDINLYTNKCIINYEIKTKGNNTTQTVEYDY